MASAAHRSRTRASGLEVRFGRLLLNCSGRLIEVIYRLLTTLIDALESFPQLMKHPFELLPRRIFLDSCTAQTLRDYGDYIYEAEPIPDSDRIHRVTDGIANIEPSATFFLSINARCSNG